ncbi:hypothetical protein NDU88_003635 [Pleurodeles waltl]|uniref:Uncharacterized protein n=1 Tax=Pleurodeles waltl TaxID=8319 RepID=A0AAV7MV57_PLEWA|nr:hypothetical protein NDU88_003635 [Pleurodeles waltl]
MPAGVESYGPCREVGHWGLGGGCALLVGLAERSPREDGERAGALSCRRARTWSSLWWRSGPGPLVGGTGSPRWPLIKAEGSCALEEVHGEPYSARLTSAGRGVRPGE